MLKIDFDPNNLSEPQKASWDALMLRAEEATCLVIKKWGDWKEEYDTWKREPAPVSAQPVFEPDFDDDLWKEIRDWLLVNVFHNKCAYCETQILRFIGDSEHFRPKGRVSAPDPANVSKNRVVEITDPSGDVSTHPGYFWLAYHWKNLLPACHICNRNGKRDLFPVEKTHVAVKMLLPFEVELLKFKRRRRKETDDIFFLEPEDLDEFEGRLLLHPYFDDPSDHLVFGTDGTIQPRKDSASGAVSITTYRLHDNDLSRAREITQFNVSKDYLLAIAMTKGAIATKQEAAQKVLDEYHKDGGPYVAAVLDYLHEHLYRSPYDPKLA